jgi:S-adenosylhomocysteine hydrolase
MAADYRSWTLLEQPPRSLPVLDEWRTIAPASGSAFEKVDVLMIQHHLGPLIPRVRAMLDEGLRIESAWFVDVPYSTCQIVVEELARLGSIEEQRAVQFVDPLAPYEPAQFARVARAIRQLSWRTNRLLVVDDGAYFLRTLQSLRSRGEDLVGRFAGRTFGVEQTTRGHRELWRMTDFIAELSMPIVSIARAITKIEIEAPFVGGSVARAVLRALSGQDDYPELGRMGRALVIGFGPVGEATARALAPLSLDGPITVLDIDPAKMSHVTHEGFRFTPRLPESDVFDLVVGCTGYAAFPLYGRFLLADGALLVSGSSAAVELNREGFVEIALADPLDQLEVVDAAATLATGIHATIHIRDRAAGRSQTLSLANAGFPINFDGEVEGLPVAGIQATHALMFAAARHVLGLTSPGVARLPTSVDLAICKLALKHLSPDRT